jgi:hypothetical protein
MSEPNISEVIGTQVESPLPHPPPDCTPIEGSDTSNAKKVENLSCWANTGDNYWGIGKTFQSLPSQCYRAQSSNTGPYLEAIPLITDDLLVLPDDSSKRILEDFTQFWALKDEFLKRGFLHKRGILMWGPPGSGKTSTIQLIIRSVIKDLDGIVLMVEHPGLGDDGLKMIRKIEPNRPVIAIFEDLDSLVRRYDENGFLSLLDGESQVNNIVHLATTNYPERLDARFIDRPSRFDLIRYIGMPSDAARRFYLEKKEPSLTPEELDQWVEFSDGLTIPHLKEMIISIKCYGKDINETVDRMKSMHKKKFNPTDAPALGFAGKSDKPY